MIKSPLDQGSVGRDESSCDGLISKCTLRAQSERMTFGSKSANFRNVLLGLGGRDEDEWSSNFWGRGQDELF